MTTNGCLYGTAAGGSTLPFTTCAFDKNNASAPAAGVQPVYNHTLSDFGACHPLSGGTACLGGGTNNVITLLNAAGTANLTLAAGASAYVVIDIAFPDTGDQSVMGTAGTLNFTFQINE